MTTVEIIGVVLYILSTTFLSGFVAKEKNRSKSDWMILGFFFGIIALIAVGGLPVVERKKPTSPSPQVPSKS